jgi:hypothetical protein
MKTQIWYLKNNDQDKATYREIQTADFTQPVCIILNRQLSSVSCKHLAQIVSHATNLCLTVSFGPAVWKEPCDLSFLDLFPQLKQLRLIYACGAKSFEPLGSLGQLTHLSIEATRSKKLSLQILEKLKNLTELSLNSQQQNIEVLASLPKLTTLRLRSVTLESLDFLKSVGALRHLWLGLGGTRNLEALSKTKLASLEIWMVSNLADLTALAKIASLEELKLDQLKHVSALPDFSQLHRLRNVELTRMSGLIDIALLSKAPKLERLVVKESDKIPVEMFRHFRAHPHLKHGAIRFKTIKKTSAVQAVLPLASLV